MTLAILARCIAAVFLLGAALAKLRGGRSARNAFASYGIGRPGARTALWGALIGVESAVAVLVALGVPGAAEAAAALLTVFGAWLMVSIARGLGGLPCGCLGARSRIGWTAVIRTVLLAAAFAALPFVPGTSPSGQTWLALGLGLALLAAGALAVAVLALAREIGELRLAVSPQPALSLEGEGPELGSTVELPRLARGERRSLAVFTSSFCPLCDALRPTLKLVASDPAVRLELYDEDEDAEVWARLSIPGSPYGVVVGPEGRVLAKGTFNNLLQLESLLGAASVSAADA